MIDYQLGGAAMRKRGHSINRADDLDRLKGDFGRARDNGVKLRVNMRRYPFLLLSDVWAAVKGWRREESLWGEGHPADSYFAKPMLRDAYHTRVYFVKRNLHQVAMRQLAQLVQDRGRTDRRGWWWRV